MFLALIITSQGQVHSLSKRQATNCHFNPIIFNLKSKSWRIILHTYMLPFSLLRLSHSRQPYTEKMMQIGQSFYTLTVYLNGLVYRCEAVTVPLYIIKKKAAPWIISLQHSPWDLKTSLIMPWCLLIRDRGPWKRAKSCSQLRKFGIRDLLLLFLLLLSCPTHVPTSCPTHVPTTNPGSHIPLLI